MKLEQGQLWKQGAQYLRIIAWARLAIEYRISTDPASKDGPRLRVTKKEFCRLIKGATLMPPEPTPANSETGKKPPEES
jgi:hypothetical protein